MSIEYFKKCYKLKEFFEDEDNKILKDKNYKMMIAKDYKNREEKIVKCFYNFKDYKSGEKFYKEEKNLYEILYNEKRKVYFDIDDIEYKKEEFEKWINNLIEILNDELKIETKMEDYLIFVDNREVIKSCHITMRKYSMHYLKQKNLNMVLKEKYKIKTDTSIYSKNQFFRFLNHSKLDKNKILINYKKCKVKFKEMLINETEKTEEFEYEKYIKNKTISKKKALKNVSKYEVNSDNIYLINKTDVKKMLNDLEDKYLYDYDLWIKITTIMKYHKLKEIWTEWSKKSVKYNEIRNEETWNCVNLKMDINWIVWILRMNEKKYEYIKYYEKIDEEYENENMVIINKEKIEYDIELLKEYDVIISRSDAGTGKSTLSSNIVKNIKDRDNNVKMMSIITNKSLINQHKKTFEKSAGIKLLNYEKDNNLIGNDFIICINSLLKINEISDKELNNYVIFIDEIDSFMYNLTHNSKLNDILREMMTLLMRILKNCKKLICCSVHIKKNLEILLSKEKKVILIENKYKNFKEVEAYEKNDMNEMIEEMMKTIDRGEYFMFASDEKLMAQEMYLKCLEKIKNKSKIILKTSTNKYEIKDASIDLKNKYFMFSPSIIFGIDFSINESQNVFLYSSGRSINSYQLFQQVCRTRNIKNVYYHFDELKIGLKYKSLKNVSEYYEKNIKSYDNIHKLCMNLDEDLNEVILKNKFFDIFCFNEYLNNIYGTNKKKKFEEIMCDSGFKIKKDNKLNKKLDKNVYERLKNEIKKSDNIRVENYIKNKNERNKEKYEDIDKRVKLLKIEYLKENEMMEYKDVIKDEKGIKNYLTTIRMLKSDEYLKSDMEERMKNTMKVKMINDINNKILLIRKLERENKIDLLDINFKEKGKVVLSNENFIFIKKVFRSARKKPKDKSELKKLYVSMIKHLNSEIVVSEKIDKIDDGERKQNIFYLNKEKIKYYLKLDKYNNPEKKYYHKKLKKELWN